MTQIIKTALKFLCNNIAMIDPKSQPTTHSMTDIYSQLPHVPESLQMFLRPIVKTNKRAAVWGRTSLRLVDLSQEICHTKSGLLHNCIIDLGQNGCVTSYTGWDTLSLTRRHKTTNTAS